MASEIDFQEAGRYELEQYFLEVAPEAMASNPSLSPEVVSALVGVGTKRKQLGHKAQELLLSRHVLRPCDKAHLMDKEKRGQSLLRLISRQTFNAEELNEFLAKDRGADASSHLVNNYRAFGLEGDPRLTQLVEQSWPKVRINHLRASTYGTYREQAARWIDEYMHSKDYSLSNGGSQCLSMLLMERPDLIDAFRELHNTTLSQILIVSGLVHEARQQLTDIQMEPVLEQPLGAENDFAVSYWIHAHRAEIGVAVASPFTRMSAIDIIAETLDGALEHAKKNGGDSTSLHRLHAAAMYRRNDCYEVTVDYGNITAETDFARIRTWIAGGANAPDYMLGTVAVLDNPAFNGLLRDRNLDTFAHRRDCRREDLNFAKHYATRPPLSGLREGSAAAFQAAARHTCEGFCQVTHPGSENPGGSCGLRNCNVYRPQSDFGSLTLDEFTKSGQHTAFVTVQTGPQVEWLTSQLGSDVACYRMFTTMVNGWEGSMKELIETTLSLALG
jgi:hypothetical protein